jgi:hypothetical protein
VVIDLQHVLSQLNPSAGRVAAHPRLDQVAGETTGLLAEVVRQPDEAAAVPDGVVAGVGCGDT